MSNQQKKSKSVAPKSATQAIVVESSKPIKQKIKTEVKEDVKNVILSIISPGLKSSVRFSSPFTTGDTSLAQLHNPFSPGFPATVDVLDTRYSNTSFVFRDPVRNMVFYDGNPSSLLSEYRVVFSLTSGGVKYPSAQYSGAPGSLSIAYQTTSAAGWDPHGNTLGIGLANGNKCYMWTQANYTWVSTRTSTGTAVLTFRVFVWDPRGEEFVGDFTHPSLSTAYSFTPNVTGYMRVEVYKRSPGTGEISMLLLDAVDAFSLSSRCTGYQFRHQPLVGYDAKSSSVEKIRVLSQGLLLSNLAPAIARGGKVATKQLPGDEPWYEYALAGYNSIARAINADVREATNGAWAYLKPTAISDFEMTDNVDYVNGEMIRFAFDLDSIRAYLGMYAVLPDADGQNIQLVSTTNIEFESDDQWYDQASSKINEAIFDQAMHAVSMMPQYNENPSHLSDALSSVKNYASKVLKAVVKYGPTALEVAGFLSSML